MNELTENDVPTQVTTEIPELDGKSAAEMREELLRQHGQQPQLQSEAETPVAEAEQAPVPGEPYQTKDGWQVDLDLQDGHGTQSFKEKTLKGLIAKMAKAQAHATRKINELNAKVKKAIPPEQAKPIQKYEAKELTSEEQWVIAQELQTNPTAAMAKVSEALYGAKPEEIRDAINTVRQLAAQQAQQAEAQSFLTAHPEYVNNKHNEKLMTEYLQKNNLALTKANLELAMEELLEAGKLENSQTTESTNSERESNRIVAPQVTRTRRASVGISTRQVSQADDEEIEQPDTPDVEELRKVPLQELRDRIVAAHHKATYRVRR